MTNQEKLFLLMLNSNGIEFRNEQGIFPLIVFNRKTQSFKCIGTSFFINGLGVFVTAKHVVQNEVCDTNMMFVIQNLSDHRTVNRVVTNLCIHPTADIAVGLVGLGRDPMTAKEVPFEVAPNCRLSFKEMRSGMPLMGFGYPKTQKITNANLTTLEFRGTWAKGTIDDYLPHGISNLKNRCYQTNMVIESGCSGGPVFSDGWVVGINSSSFEMTLEETPISFITTVDYLLDLQLPVANELLSVREMAHRGKVIVEY